MRAYTDKHTILYEQISKLAPEPYSKETKKSKQKKPLPFPTNTIFLIFTTPSPYYIISLTNTY